VIFLFVEAAINQKKDGWWTLICCLGDMAFDVGWGEYVDVGRVPIVRQQLLINFLDGNHRVMHRFNRLVEQKQTQLRRGD